MFFKVYINSLQYNKKLCTHKKKVYSCFCSNSNWEDPKYLSTGEKINFSTLSKWNITQLLKKRMHFVDTCHNVLVLSKRRYLTKCGKNWCTHEKWAWVFRDALFIVIQTGKSPFMCDSKKEDTTETDIWPTVARGWKRGRTDHNETWGHFSGGATLTTW